MRGLWELITTNDIGINEGGMVNGVLSRKVEITLNSAVSLVQTLQPLLFIPCYKSGGGWSGKCSETGEVTISLYGMKNSNQNQLYITPTAWRSGGFNPQKSIRITNVQ